MAIGLAAPAVTISAMSQTDFFPQQPRAILRMPSWLGNDVTEDRDLPLEPGDYKITPGAGDERWTVVSLKTSELIYSGIGPVEITRLA